MIDIKENISKVTASLPHGVELLAVTSRQPVEALRQAYNCGVCRFGENDVDEMLAKQPQLPDDIKWHFIGRLRPDQVSRTIGRVEMIESVDSVGLLNAIDRESERAGIVTKVLVQLQVSREEPKFGFSVEELMDYFDAHGFESLKATHICGLAGIASDTDDMERVASDYREIARCHNLIKNDQRLGLRGFDTLSMGTTKDYMAAIVAGSTRVRIGRGIFGH